MFIVLQFFFLLLFILFLFVYFIHLYIILFVFIHLFVCCNSADSPHFTNQFHVPTDHWPSSLYQPFASIFLVQSITNDRKNINSVLIFTANYTNELLAYYIFLFRLLSGFIYSFFFFFLLLALIVTFRIILSLFHTLTALRHVSISQRFHDLP